VLGDQLGDDDVRLIRPSLDAHGPEPGWPPSTSALRPDLIRQKSGAITGARPTGRVAPASDDDGEQPTPARLRKSRHVLEPMHGRDLRSDGSAPAGVRFVNGSRVRGMGGKLRGSRAEWMAPPARPGTPSTLVARRLRLPGHHPSEGVRLQAREPSSMRWDSFNTGRWADREHPFTPLMAI
jgi:hypothetical protein